MARCLACLGEGLHDFRDDNALLGEHLDDKQLELVRSSSAWQQPIQVCEECEGTGEITQERHDEIVAVARAAIDQVMARIEEEGKA